MMLGVMIWSFLSIPASAFSAFIRQAEAAPSSAVVLPVMMRPSGSSMATAGPSVSSARRSAAATTGRSAGPAPMELRISSIFRCSAPSERPSRTAQAAAYQRRMISCFEASQQASSSKMQKPAMFTPMSVGLLYGLSP